MANTKSSSNGRSSSTMSKSNSDKEQLEFSQGMQSSQLMKLFEEELKDIYWAEKALTKAIPKMIKMQLLKN